ncbi:hypothetical protein AMJ86_05325, partial [bacterium SM23_57]
MGKMRWMMALLLVPAMLMAASPGDVVINEVMWMGSFSSSSDEWIELYNTTSSVIDLTGWYILDDGAYTYNLSGTIAGEGYYLIERREEATDVTADVIVTSISLANSGDALELFDGSSNSIDLVSTGGGWYAGAYVYGSTYYSMERINPAGPDNASNWDDNDSTIAWNGLDSGGVPISGTPRQQNSVYSTSGGDTDPPELESAYAMGATRVDVLCNEPLDPTTAQAAGNYAMDPDVGVTAAVLDGSNPAMVHLTTGTMSVGTLYTLTMSDVEDTAGNAMVDAEDSFYGGISPVSFARQDLTDGDFYPDLMGEQVTVQGIVSAGDYTFSDYYTDFYLQDATAGIDCYEYGTVLGANVGDEMIISGVIGIYNGKTELMGPFGIELVSTGNPVFASPHIYTVDYI